MIYRVRMPLVGILYLWNRATTRDCPYDIFIIIFIIPVRMPFMGILYLWNRATTRDCPYDIFIIIFIIPVRMPFMGIPIMPLIIHIIYYFYNSMEMIWHHHIIMQFYILKSLFQFQPTLFYHFTRII